MNKKSIIIICCIAVVIIFTTSFYLFGSNRNSGLNPNIKNQNNKSTNIASLKNKKILVVYFSETGNTQKMAKIISDEVGGDFRRLETVKDYPKGKQLFDYTKKEQENNERPKLKDLNVNMDEYDIVFVGYPIWWYTLPMPLYTFFDKYDFSNKTIVPFNTHNGSSDGGTYETIKELEPNAKVLDGLAISGSSMSNNQTSTIRKWLKSLDY